MRVLSPNSLGSTSGDTNVASGATVEINGNFTLSTESFLLQGTGAGGAGALSGVGTPTVPGVLEYVAAGSMAAPAGSTLTISGGVQLDSGVTVTLAGAGNIVDNAPIYNIQGGFSLSTWSARLWTGTPAGTVDFSNLTQVNNAFVNGTVPTSSAVFPSATTFQSYSGALNFPQTSGYLQIGPVFGQTLTSGGLFTDIYSTTLTISKPGIFSFLNGQNDDGVTIWLKPAANSTFAAGDSLQTTAGNNLTQSVSKFLAAGTYTLLYTHFEGTGSDGWIGRMAGPGYIGTTGTSLPLATAAVPVINTVSVNIGGTGTVTMNAQSTFLGVTAVTTGTLVVPDPTVLSPTTVPIVITGGTLQLTNQTWTTKPIVIAGTGLPGVGAISAFGTSTISSPINVELGNGNGSIGAVLATSNLTLSGPIKVDTDAGFTLTGAGNVNVTGAISNVAYSDFTLAPFTARLYNTVGGVGNVLFDGSATGIANINSAVNGTSPIAIGTGITGTLATTVTYNGALNFPTAALAALTSVFGMTPGVITAAAPTGGDNFSDVWISTLTVTTPGIYTFANTNNDDGASVWLHTGTTGAFVAGDRLLGVLANNNTSIAQATLAAGLYTVVYNQDDGTRPEAFIGRIAGPAAGGAAAAVNNGTTVPIATSVAGGPPTGTGTVGVGMSAGGTATFSNASNSYKNSTAVSAGTLVVGAAGAVPSTSGLILGNGTTTAGTLDLAGFSQTFTSLLVNSNTAAANVIKIAAGTTLTVTGNVQIGANIGTNDVTNVVFNGGGTFNMNAPSSTFQLGNPTAGSAHAVAANADMTSLSTVIINATTVRLGDNNSNLAAGTAAGVGGSTLSLPTTGGTAASATITAATLSIGGEASTNADNTANVFQTLNLGSGTNIINANAINIGANSSLTNTIRGNGVLTWSPSVTTGTLTIANQARQRRRRHAQHDQHRQQLHQHIGRHLRHGDSLRGPVVRCDDDVGAEQQSGDLRRRGQLDVRLRRRLPDGLFAGDDESLGHELGRPSLDDEPQRWHRVVRLDHDGPEHDRRRQRQRRHGNPQHHRIRERHRRRHRHGRRHRGRQHRHVGAQHRHGHHSDFERRHLGGDLDRRHEPHAESERRRPRHERIRHRRSRAQHHLRNQLRHDEEPRRRQSGRPRPGQDRRRHALADDGESEHDDAGFRRRRHPRHQQQQRPRHDRFGHDRIFRHHPPARRRHHSSRRRTPHRGRRGPGQSRRHRQPPPATTPSARC